MLYRADPQFHSLADENTSPYEFINQAIERELFSDIVIFLAHALPVRESVWWAVTCASTRDDWNDAEQKAISAASDWVYTPDEASRRHAERMAKIAQLGSGAGWAAQAAFWSAGSMTNPGDPVVLPPQFLYAQAVAGSVNLSAILPTGELALSRYHTFLTLGLDIAQGGTGSYSGV